MNTLRWILLFVGALLLFAIYWFDRKRRPPTQHRFLDDLEEAQAQPEATYGSADDDEPRISAVADMNGGMERREPSFGVSRHTPDEEVDAPQPMRQRPVTKPVEVERPVAKAPTPPPVISPPRQPLTHASGPHGTTVIASASRSGGDERLVVLHVIAPDAMEFTGESLAEAFSQAELQYGERQVFQRTVKFGGKDEMLFQVANMLKPGTFDLSRLRELRSRGVSLFMQLPGPIDALKAFNIMLHCAQVLAEKLGGEVLDSARHPLDQVGIERLRSDIQLFGLKLRKAGQED